MHSAVGLSYRKPVRLSLSVRPSVCISVCHTRGLCPHDSSLLKFRLYTPTAWPTNSRSHTNGVGKNVIFSIKNLKQFVSRKRYGESYYRPLIATHNIRAFDWYHVRWPWMTFEGHFSLFCHSGPRPISRKLYAIRPQKLKLLIRNHTTAFSWYDCR